MSRSMNKLKVVLLYLAGYGYYFLLIAGIIGFFVIILYSFAINARVAVKLVLRRSWPVFLLLIGLLKGLYGALSAKIPAPEGIDVGKEEFPEFHELLEEIRVKLKCPKIHHVKFDLDLNAHVSEVPKYGVFGGFRRYLVVGIPLMLVLSKNELRAVLGHELGHLSKAHGKMAVRILRADNLWRKASEELLKSGKDKNMFFRLFLFRYIPALTNASLSLRRENEFVADKAAEYVTDSETVTTAFVKLPLYDSYLDSLFWNRIKDLAKVEKTPPQNVFHQMEKFLDEPIPEEIVNFALPRILKVKSLPCWRHPSISERLNNIDTGLQNLGGNPEDNGEKIIFPEHRKVNSLRDILGDKADVVLNRANDLWATAIAEEWSQSYESCEESRRKLAQLEDKKRRNETLTDKEEIERILLIEAVESDERALEAFRLLHESNPDDPVVAYYLGRLMIKCGDSAGEDILLEVMKNDAEAIPYCCEVLYNFYRKAGNVDKAKEYYYLATEFMATDNDINRERNTVRFSDTYIPHDLDIDTIEEMRRKMLEKGYVKCAYVAIKELKDSRQFPLYIILVKVNGLLSFTRRKKLQELPLQVGEEQAGGRLAVNRILPSETVHSHIYYAGSGKISGIAGQARQAQNQLGFVHIR